jgi:ABC-2 type transport system ATP-binding protein
MTSEPVVSVAGLVVRYGTTDAVRGLDATIERGGVVGLIGPDGAGKTSTLRTIAGLQRASAGSVTVLGRDAWRHRRALHHRLGYLAQRFALYGDLTVAENAQFFGLLLGIRDWRGRRAMLLERVGLAPFAGRLADRLSGGMRQKLALACALMHEPEVLLLDEPTTGIDPVTRRELWKLLADLVADGLTLLLATPYLDEAERCTRVILMDHGRVLAHDAPAALRTLLPGTMVEIDATPRQRVAAVLSTLPAVLDVQPFAARFHARIGTRGFDLKDIERALTNAAVEVRSIRVIPATLEDTFLHLTRTRGAEEAA